MISKKAVKKIGLYIIVVVMAVYCLWPFYFLLNASLQPTKMAYQSPPVIYPKAFTLSNYINVFRSIPLSRYLLNSVVVSSFGTLLALFAGSLCAFAISKLIKRNKGEVMLDLLIIVGFFPMVVALFPLYKLMRSLNLLNNYLGLILPYAAFNLPLTVWVMTTHFDSLPSELYDAAIVDGASVFKIFNKIMLPLSAPALATVGILNFISCWNEFMLALTFMTNKYMYTVTVGLSLISGRFTFQFPWGEIIAGTLIVTVPLVIVVLIAQEKIISGLTAGALKG